MAIAERLATVIISADSRQVYRGFDIGTAKPTPADQQQIPHYLIDICNPTDTFTVADYQHQVQQLITTLHCSHSAPYPLLVGGTGLYIRAITQGMTIPNIAPQQDLRAQLHQLGQSQCYAMLQQVDPVAATKIHPHDPVRTIRALEVFYVTGKPISKLQLEQPPPYPILHLGLDCPDSDRLKQRIAQRTSTMLDMGFVAEVEALCQQYGNDLPLLATLGYREINQYLAGAISLHQAETLIVQHTRQFAKRQRTWFRANPAIVWFDADSSNIVEQVWDCITSWLSMLPPSHHP
ncbi:MAG: tRNA (adenosine(37)-N6)-dimethylallyltransferase MiaA [Cyanobacteria bacterium]|nr:tRNA (adenosine(37)-N6)-dimethylallyltransferase MiaA [Cyanobacteriota bacterium]MDW8202684.1 tRNA (adenosine(37)-N6)-dimethylallyltransferase MiaA [Cyanobacteriota bacterium SKYGB_h_bin112]